MATKQLQLVRSVGNGLKQFNKCSERAFSTSFVKLTNDPTISNAPTHTGQKFADDDYRNARFLTAARHVNTRHAIDLIARVPPKETKARIVACDGGGGPLGHPKVYINLDKPGNHTCGYCGLRFTKPEDHHH
uniref:EOG090X0NBY n=1 Tax=Moina brachiata TaxID=675436 RepID=A0A4Y7NLE9_9CRUS|nr:EOG090X0NBY [Moina brachiata]SVE93424.1 EOG090X0NBY [Moina brachiata]